MRNVALVFLVAVSLLAVTSACQSTSSGQVASPIPSQLAFPTHNEPLATDLGFYYLAGELRVEDGCLKLYRLGWDDPNRSISDQLWDIWLPVWPSGFALRQTGDGEARVVDQDGRVVAEASDTVRLSGPSSWSEEAWEELRETIPRACRLPYWPVGDEVYVVTRDDPAVVPLPGSTLYFSRGRTRKDPGAHMAAKPPEDQTLTLNGDCLRVGKDGPVIVWPPGFYPDRVDGRVVVRNGGGRVVARVGQTMRLDSGGYVADDRSGPCRGTRWLYARLLKLPTTD